MKKWPRIIQSPVCRYLYEFQMLSGPGLAYNPKQLSIHSRKDGHALCSIVRTGKRMIMDCFCAVLTQLGTTSLSFNSLHVRRKKIGVLTDRGRTCGGF